MKFVKKFHLYLIEYFLNKSIIQCYWVDVRCHYANKSLYFSFWQLLPDLRQSQYCKWGCNRLFGEIMTKLVTIEDHTFQFMKFTFCLV